MKINEQVRMMGYFTISDAARLIGKSPDTLRRWKRLGIYEASYSAMFGQTEVDCYSQDDITQLRKVAKGIKPGRIPTKNKRLQDRYPPLGLVS